MEVVLKLKQGPARTQSVRLRSAETIIGRSRDCDLCIPSPQISRRHCLLTLGGDRLTVEDLTSANGTYLNGERVTGIRPVETGDQLRIGPLIFTIEFHATGSALEALDAGLDASSSAAPSNGETAYEVVDAVPVEPKKATPPPPAKKSTPPKKPAPEPETEYTIQEDVELKLPEGKDFLDLLHGMDK